MKYITVILLILSCLSVSAQESTRKERNFIKEGNEYFSKGNYENALKCYKMALVENPESETALYNRALAQTMINPDKGDTLFLDCVKLISNNKLKEKCYYNLGNIYFQKGDSIQIANGGYDQTGCATSPEAIEQYKKSINYYKDVLRLNPENENARYNLRVAQLRIPQNDNQQGGGSSENDEREQQEQNQNQDQPQNQQNPNNQENQENQENAAANTILEQVEKDEERTRRRVMRSEQNNATPSDDDSNPINGTVQQKPW